MPRIFPTQSRLSWKIHHHITLCLLSFKMVALPLNNQASTSSSQHRSAEESPRWALEKSMRATTSCRTLWSHSTPKTYADASREERHSTQISLALTNFSIVWNHPSIMLKQRSCTARCTLSHCVRWTWCKCFSRRSRASPRWFESRRKSSMKTLREKESTSRKKGSTSSQSWSRAYTPMKRAKQPSCLRREPSLPRDARVCQSWQLSQPRRSLLPHRKIWIKLMKFPKKMQNCGKMKE